MANVSLLRYGFVLILLALLTGLAVPALALPRLGLAAHTVGVLGGVLLIAVGAVWAQFRLSARQQGVLKWAWLWSSYVNWLACLAGAVLRAGRLTPIAAEGSVGTTSAEAVVTGLLASVAVASFIAVGLSLWGLAPRSGRVS